MADWRVINDGDESTNRVAPVCPSAATNHLREDDDGAPLPVVDWLGVYDCCPGPQIECFSRKAAVLIAQSLTYAEAEVCT